MNGHLRVDRMRRYVARTTPDQWDFVLNDEVPTIMHSDDFRRWQEMMRIKHPGAKSIDLHMEQDADLARTAIVTARVVLR